MSLFNELFLELEELGIVAEVEVGSDPQLMCISRNTFGDDPLWVEELSPSEVCVYLHSSDDGFCAGSFNDAIKLIRSF